MKHSVFLVCRNVPNYSSYLTTKNTDFSKKNVEYWSLDREKATVFFSKQAAEEHIQLYTQKLLEYTAKKIHDSELFCLEVKRKKYLDAYDTYWYQQKVLIPMEVQP
mgnify:FL=1